MSAIDQYDYTVLGIIFCPSAYFSVVRFGRPANTPTYVCIYRLDQDVPPDEFDFRGRKGDILLSGGSGEAPALHIWIPETLKCLTGDCDDVPVNERGRTDLYQAFWKPTDAYMLCEGFAKQGWTPDAPIESWLAEHTLAFLAREYPDEFGRFVGPEPLALDGSICRRLTDEEDRIGNWKKYG